MSTRIQQPIELLARLESRADHPAFAGPFLAVAYDPFRASVTGPGYRSLGSHERLCGAMDAVLAGSASRSLVIDWVLSRDDRDDDDEQDDRDTWESLERLSDDELRARVVTLAPELDALTRFDYVAFALDGGMEYCASADQSEYFEALAHQFPAWEFVMGWAARPPLQDSAFAFLVPREAPAP